MKSFRTISRIASSWREWPLRCSNVDCSRSLLLHAITKRLHGIALSDGWYCCPDCFQTAVRNRIHELINSATRSARLQSSRIPLGLLLHSRGILSQEQLKQALESQRARGGNFGDAVQQLGFASAEQVTAAVAAQWACPVFPLGSQPLATQIRIPKQLLALYAMLPVHFSEKGRVLLIAFVNGVQYQIVHTIEHITECAVQPCFITAREYEQRIHSISPEERENELYFEHTNSEDMARIIRNYVVQLGAAKSRVGRCRDVLWARIWGRKTEVDLLFRLHSD